MISPTKHMDTKSSLVGIGYDILTCLNEPKTVSRLWSDFRTVRGHYPQGFDWFVLSLDFLYAVGLVGLDSNGHLWRNKLNDQVD